jgi:hypothetical protein
MSGGVGRVLLLLGPLALTACSAEPWRSESSPQQVAEQGPSIAPSASSVSDPLPSANGLPPRLAALTAADREADPLEGELGCDFTSLGETLLIAMGDVGDTQGHAQALAKVGDSRKRLRALEGGGFDGLPNGAVFSEQGMTITVTLTSDKPTGGGESPPYPAQVLLQRADGFEWAITGLWTCGP